ncbi:GHKL domain-containing protein [Geovibrio thiophilus]|uniref:histidine kinase n=1 Tax=Geovibrio thiophilus TaxID=139438 RepID=A0A410JVC4_9BACT|nr:ATP-binding protein [Geovibrio thiophilus]QAR32113.1 GHKL domain-containing protein [Geovibrio thiophilus]
MSDIWMIQNISTAENRTDEYIKDALNHFMETAGCKAEVIDRAEAGKTGSGAIYICIDERLLKITEISENFSLKDAEIFARIMELEIRERKYRQEITELKELIHRNKLCTCSQIKIPQAALFRQEKLAAIGQLSAGIAHELNNPIGFISCNFDVLKNYASEIRAFISEAGRISDSAAFEKAKSAHRIDEIISDTEDIFTESEEGFRRITGIVANLLAFARSDANRLKRGSFNNAVANTVSIAKSEFKFTAEVITEAGDLPEFIFNTGEISQVLLNILLNAVQAIKQQKKAAMGLIVIKTWEEDGFACCSIKDDGPGIKPESADRVFEPFFTTKPIGEGTGLGLNVSYDIIVNKHKGSISAENNPNGGAVFSFRIPMIDETAGSDGT